MAEANVESSAPPPEDGPGEGGKEETKEEQEGDRAFEVGKEERRRHGSLTWICFSLA